MPRPHPPEFHQRAAQLAREQAKPIAQITHDLEISESCLHNWAHQAEIKVERPQQSEDERPCRRHRAAQDVSDCGRRSLSAVGSHQVLSRQRS